MNTPATHDSESGTHPINRHCRPFRGAAPRGRYGLGALPPWGVGSARPSMNSQTGSVARRRHKPVEIPGNAHGKTLPPRTRALGRDRDPAGTDAAARRIPLHRRRRDRRRLHGPVHGAPPRRARRVGHRSRSRVTGLRRLGPQRRPGDSGPQIRPGRTRSDVRPGARRQARRFRGARGRPRLRPHRQAPHGRAVHSRRLDPGRAHARNGRDGHAPRYGPRAAPPRASSTSPKPIRTSAPPVTAPAGSTGAAARSSR